MPYFTNRGITPLPAVGGGDITTGVIHRYWMDTDSKVISGSILTDDVGTLHGNFGSGTSDTTSPSGAVKSTASAFDGSADGYMSLPSVIFDFVSGGPYSIACWIKLTDVTVTGRASTRATFFNSSVDASDTNMIRILNNTGIGAGTLSINAPTSAAGVSTPTGSLVNNTWHHFCYTDTGNGAVKKLYFDGSLIASPGASTSSGVSEAITRIGCSNNNTGADSGGAITGSMYRLEIWNRVLSAADVTLLYTTK